MSAAIEGASAKYEAPTNLGDGAQLKCTPITLYQSEPAPRDSLGNQIAVSARFVSYAIKGGKIRVLTRSSATRTLLRGHGATIVDLAFAEASADGSEATLASACADGTLVVWLVAEAGEDEEVRHEAVATVEKVGATRVAWRPGGGAVLAVALDASARVVDVEDVANLAAAPALEHEASVNDVRWNRDGSALATAADDGLVRCWRFDDALTPQLLVAFEPLGGSAVCSAAFLDGGDGRARLVTGTSGNEALQFWAVPADGGDWDEPELRQTLALAPSKTPQQCAPRRLVVDDTAQFVVVAAEAADGAGAALYVAHVDPEATRVDHVAPFAVSQPVLSLVALDAPLGGDGDAHDAEADGEPSGFEVQLFCVQTKAIQQYFLRPSALYPGAVEPRGGGAAAPAAPAAPAAAAPPPPPPGMRDDEPAAGGDPLARFAALHLGQGSPSPSPPPPPTLDAPRAPTPASRPPSAPASRPATPAAAAAPAAALPRAPSSEEILAVLEAANGTHRAELRAEARDAAARAAMDAARLATDSGVRSIAQIVSESLARAAEDGDRRGRDQSARLAQQFDQFAAAIAGRESRDAPARDQRQLEAARLGSLEAFRDCFAAQLVPAVQAATQRMFAQVDAQLQARLDRFEAAERDGARRLEAKVDALGANVATLLEALNARGGGAAAAAPPALPAAPPPPAPPAPPAPSAASSVQAELRDLADAGDYDACVYKAVECSDVDVLLFALDAVGLETVRSLRPLPFGQLTLLCLLQQLGTTLERDGTIALKLEWLQLSILGLDAANPRISNHVPEVLKQVKTCMENLSHPVKAEHHAKVSILAHIINSLLAR